MFISDNIDSVNIYRSLALSSSVTKFNTRRSCDEVGTHFNNRQVQVCKRNVDVMNSVKFGATIAVQECQHQFRYRRWNCTTLQFEKSPVFGNSVNGGRQHFRKFYSISARHYSNYCNGLHQETVTADRYQKEHLALLKSSKKLDRLIWISS